MKQQVKSWLKSITTPQMRSAVRQLAIRIFVLLKGTSSHTTLPIGVNLIGYIRGDFGLGESCRLVAAGLQKTGLPFTIRNVSVYGDAPETNETWRAYEKQELPYGVNLIHLNPDGLANRIWDLGRKTFRNHYNIGFYLWEQPEFPTEWSYAIDLMDEIWAPAEFISQAIRTRTTKPVYTMPYGMTKPETSEHYQRDHFGLPNDVFLFMVSYDGYSSSERKNPLGSVRAYCQAFSKEETGVGLVLKATHAREEDLQQFHTLLDGYPNVVVLKDSYSKVEFNSLIACVDVYVSLHRAEGFGLVMAEAMELGTAVIATDWSANTEFMNEDVACMVPAKVITLEQDSPPYKKGTHWAEPDEPTAAQWMKQLYNNPDFYQEKVQKAKSYIQEKLSQTGAAERMRQRIEELFKEKSHL